MSTRTWHVSNSESHSPLELLPLPAPSTTNNLLPRFAITALSRRRNNRSFLLGLSSHPDNLGSSSRSPRPSSRRREIMQTATAQTRSRGSSSRPLKRRRTRNNNYDNTHIREGWGASDSEEGEVDQPTSDADNDSLPPPSQSVGESSQATVESQSTSAVGSFTDIGILAPSRSSVSSPSLAKILHPVNIEQTPAPSTSVAASSSSSTEPAPTKPSRRSKPNPKSQGQEPPRAPPPEREHEPLSAYTCPICFFPPTNATLTPCGHICCGSCLFTAVKTTMQRGAATSEGSVARCPVCRAEISKWDGKGGGVIGLKPRAVLSL